MGGVALYRWWWFLSDAECARLEALADRPEDLPVKPAKKSRD
jgi:hypothetical protein